MVSDERSVVSNNWSSVMNTMVGNNRGMVGSVGNNRGMVGSVGNNRGVVGSMSNNRGVVGSMSNNRGVVGSVGNNKGMVGRLGMRLSFISHISNESILMVSVVGHNLNSAIGQLNSVFSLDNAELILSFSLGKVSSVLVGEWLWWHLLRVVRSRSVCRGRVVRCRSRCIGRCWNIANISWSSKSC